MGYLTEDAAKAALLKQDVKMPSAFAPEKREPAGSIDALSVRLYQVLKTANEINETLAKVKEGLEPTSSGSSVKDSGNAAPPVGKLAGLDKAINDLEKALERTQKLTAFFETL